MKPLKYLMLLTLFAGTMIYGNETLKLWRRQPAQQWEEALPVGNGRLGAMVYGGLKKDRIQYNEETLWTGVPQEYCHPGAAAYLDSIRRLLFDGKQKEAQDLAMAYFISQPLRQERCQPFADLILEFPGHDMATDYYHELDLRTAMATTPC